MENAGSHMENAGIKNGIRDFSLIDKHTINIITLFL